MADWTSSMQRTYEFYTVDPGTWKDSRKLNNVKSCTISRDADAETLGSATIDVSEALGECYIRIYLITIQNGVKERYPLGTFLVQTPSSTFDGKIRTVSMDAYTPLLELKENPPPLGYFIPENSNVMEKVYLLCRENARAPVVKANCDEVMHYDFVSNTNDTWLTFLIDLLKNVKYEFALDEMGRILFSPVQDTASLQPVWTFDDGNSSILYSDITMNHDLYGIPNVVEVAYSYGAEVYKTRIVNDDPNSPTSTINRGREIVKPVNNPSFSGVPTKEQLDEYAKKLLRELSSVEYTISYSHAYCPVRLGDCVRLNYSRAGITDIKARVVSQTINCDAGCKVSEKAIFTTKLWG